MAQSESTLPVDYFTGLRLDTPLQTSLTTGEAIRLSGLLTDTSLSKIQFHFSPTNGDDPTRFFFDVIAGRFDGHLLFSHEQAGEYELDLYVYDKEEDSWPWLDSFSPVQILDRTQISTLGDVDGDGQVSLADALLVLQAAIGTHHLDTKQTQTADVNFNGRLDPTDALFILQASLDQRILGKMVVTAKPTDGAPFPLHGRLEDIEENLYLLRLSIPDRTVGAFDLEFQFDPQLIEYTQTTPPQPTNRSTLVCTDILESGTLRVMGIAASDTELTLDLHFRRRSQIPSTITVTKFRYYDANGREQSTISPTTFSSDLAPIPGHFALHPNFPNPFNAITTIRYELPIMTNGVFTPVHLAIYNITGQKIQTLLDQPQKPGYYKITWNGIDDYGLPVSSGVYFYRIVVGDQIQSRPLLLLR